jgi:hypothetical protein
MTATKQTAESIYKSHPEAPCKTYYQLLKYQMNQMKGYLDAKDGDMSAGDTWYAVLKPQAIGLL